MGRLNKRQAHLKKARASLKTARIALAEPAFPETHVVESLLHNFGVETEEGSWTPGETLSYRHWDWDPDSESEPEVEFTEGEDDGEPDDERFQRELGRRASAPPPAPPNALALMMQKRAEPEAFSHAFKYQRSTELSLRQQQRKNKEEDERGVSAMDSHPLSKGFLQTERGVGLSRDEMLRRERSDAVKALKKKLVSKKNVLVGQDLTRHRAVLMFMELNQSRQLGETREGISIMASRCCGKGISFARKIVTWELTWMTDRTIEEGRQGCFAKTKSWYDDEGVQLAVREYLSEAGEHITAYRVAQAVGRYLDSRRATTLVENSFGPGGNRIRAHTARRWLNKMGMSHSVVRKGVYVDEHERDEVVFYRKHIFIKRWKEFERRMVIFNEDGTWQLPPGLLPGEKPHVLVTHDESTFNANDGKRRMWMKEGQPPLRPKSRGKGIMVSGFLTPGGILRIPDHVPDSELLMNPMWPLLPGSKPRSPKPVREALEYLEYGKNNYWTSDKMVKQTLLAAVPIFRYAFHPNFQALWAFDNASNHCCFSDAALVAHKMNRNPGGSQLRMREGFWHDGQRPQAMFFPDNQPNVMLRGEAKGIEQVLRERGLWRHRRADGRSFLLQYPTTNDRSGCDLSVADQGGCCMRSVMAAQRDFHDQEGKLQEELESLLHEVIFYPKFHCELNFIERFWCRRDNNLCSYCAGEGHYAAACPKAKGHSLNAPPMPQQLRPPLPSLPLPRFLPVPLSFTAPLWQKTSAPVS